MTDREAYDKLLNDRPVIVAVLRSVKDKYLVAEQMAEKVTDRNDPADLVELILKAARYIKAEPAI